MEKITGAAMLLKSLLCQKTELIFGYPGGAIMPIYDALFSYNKKIRHILTRHEQGAIHSAQGYSRVTGKTGVCFATSGPGATNLITGICDAMLDSTPVVCITGQVPSNLLGTDAFQEANIISMTTSITKWNYQITKANEIPFVIAKAFYIAMTGRPGPVLIDITKDAQFELTEYEEKLFSFENLIKINNSGYLNNISLAINLINKAKKPYLLVGHGVTIAKAEDEILKFTNKTRIPVASTLLGLSAFPCNHPLYVGMLGMHGNYGANILTNEADLIIAVGMRFDDRVTGNLKSYAKQAKIIHIDIDPSEINKNVICTVPLVGDAKEILQILINGVEKNNHDNWLKKFRECDDIEYQEVIKKDLEKSDEKEIKMAEVINLLSEKTNGKSILVTDVGQHQMIAARYYKFTNNNSHITSGGLGTMGFALPAAIGAKLGAEEREVIAIIGDGGFQMNIQELGVVMQENIPLKIIVLNNSFLGMVRQWQELFFENRISSTEMHNPNFIKIIEGYGIRANKAENHTELNDYLDELLASKESYFLEVKVIKNENVFPMIPAGAGVSDVRFS
ncbi:biosynthetic-type acetolactate synthase large subunit [Fluviispira multicolorata]|uniref:Acetolactate synthase n=1 Tax=Fluviispira multicolorata TaxID=2654512 RepID=A0A833JFN2_9BACT|nr:biosynthetic-type acetolactate synthase large subunit [Fluviispira multicolorata]KAB8031737.1 biosynthetic-type acetolactate synthase large subunit [Fluviispira multicolorata]